MFSTTLDVRSLSELEGRWTQQASVVLGVCTRFTLPDLQSKHGSLKVLSSMALLLTI